MISVDELWTLLQDVIRKDHLGGYMSSEEFNRRLSIVQNVLFDYYFNLEDETESREALIPFFRTKRLPSSDNRIFTLPAYREKLEIWIGAREDCAEADLYIPVHFPARNELIFTVSSPVRGPSLSKKSVVGEFRNGLIKIWPEIPAPYTVNMNYYIDPPSAVRGYTVDPDTDEEVIDAASTTDLVWGADCMPDFLDLMLFYQGLVLRSSSLVEWVQAKKVLTAV